MNLVEIDGKVYDAIVVGISRTAEVKQSENAGATLAEGAEEVLDPKGTFISYNITFRRKSGCEREFDELWELLINPRYSGVWVKVIYNQTILNFKAKFSVTTQDLVKYDRITGKVYWGTMTVSCQPVKAQVLPI